MSQPLSESTFMILLSLASGPKHGYAVMKDVSALSDGRVRLATGTLYGALARLLDEGLIERIGDEEVEGRTRRKYRLTPAGHRAAQGEATRLTNLVAAAVQRLAPGYAS